MYKHSQSTYDYFTTMLNNFIFFDLWMRYLVAQRRSYDGLISSTYVFIKRHIGSRGTLSITAKWLYY